MPRRRWGDPWQQYPASKPLPAESGIATSKQRGEMASTWWSQRVTAMLDSYGLGARMQRGRRYARQGQLVSFDVEPGLVSAQVQGSRRAPYLVTVAFAVPPPAQWEQIQAAMRARVAFAARLLSGEVPPELEEVFDSAGVALLPRRWTDLRANCSCPDWENPCKHIAAVLYVLADRLDADPWLLLTWRGRERDELLAGLRAAGGTSGAGAAAVAPWWPLVPGAGLRPSRHAAPLVLTSEPGAVLRRCAPLAIEIHGSPAGDLLLPAYAALAAATVGRDANTPDG